MTPPLSWFQKMRQGPRVVGVRRVVVRPLGQGVGGQAGIEVRPEPRGHVSTPSACQAGAGGGSAGEAGAFGMGSTPEGEDAAPEGTPRRQPPPDETFASWMQSQERWSIMAVDET